MHFTFFTQLALAAAVFAQTVPDPPGHEFMAPGPTDQRSPCPFLNTLANHAYLPRNGLNINTAQFNEAFDTAFNVDPAITGPIVAKALNGTNKVANGTLNLSDVDKHGLIEHDASLSRADAAVGDNVNFNATVWNSVAAFFVTPTISIDQFGRARNARVADATAANRAIDFSSSVATTSATECSFVMQIFSGGAQDGGANTAQVDKLFREERLPLNEGYVRPAQRLTPGTVMAVAQKIASVQAANATGMAGGMVRSVKFAQVTNFH